MQDAEVGVLAGDIIARARALGVPTFGMLFGQFVEAGALFNYSKDIPEANRSVALLLSKILKGASPADLPVEQPTRFRLRINMKTAKVLGLTIPPSILARADEVIE